MSNATDRHRPRALAPGLRSLRTAALVVAATGTLVVGGTVTAQTPTPAAAPPPPETAAPATVLEAFRAGTFHLGLRYRFEHVDDETFADTAEASTLRTTLSYVTGRWRGWSLFLEAEDVSPVFDDDGYANAGRGGRSNGVLGLPVIADPEGTAMGQAFVRWQDDHTRVTLGRQEIVLGDERFVGAVGWRQHHQSFDAARVEWGRGRFATDYSYVAGVQRIFGDRLQLDGHLLQVQFEPWADHTWTGYGFSLDYDDPSALSTSTFGIELAGRRAVSETVSVRYEAEAAEQRDTGDNPLSVDTDYRLGSLGLGVGSLALSATWELLGGAGGGDRAFATPLATLHKWNGWADQFLQTPPEGLETVSFEARGPLGPRLAWIVAYHDFAADQGDLDFGSEVDVQLTYVAPWQQTFAVKLADYSAGDRSTDTRKIMVWSSYTF